MFARIIILTVLIIVIIIAVIFVFQNLKDDEDENSEDLLNQQKATLNLMPASTPAPKPAENQGVKIEVLKEGLGQKAKAGDKIAVHYTGILLDGTTFDSSVDRGQPFVFTLGVGQVIQGWDQGVLGMKVGEKRILTIPPELGYGAAGTPGGPIPPNATLIFEVEFIGFEN